MFPDRFGFDRGPEAIVTLFFDGSASPNPGQAAWGAEAIIKITNMTEKLRWSAPIGHSTSNAAEYLGLISGLRRVISFLQFHSVRYSYARLKIQGDSKLVFDHLTGRADVRSPLLSPLYEIASNLVAQFMNVEFVLCPRERNRSANRLANEARQANPSPTQKAIFYPALTNFVDAWVGNSHSLASHDFITAGSDPSFFVDVRFLQSLPGGEQLLKTIQDPHPLSVVLANVDMTVLGITTLDVGISFSPAEESGHAAPEEEQRALVDVIVVHWMPVPIHVSHRHPQVRPPDMFSSRSGLKYNGLNVSQVYAQHPYWRSHNFFIGP